MIDWVLLQNYICIMHDSYNVAYSCGPVNVSVYSYLSKQVPNFQLLLTNIIFKAFFWHIHNACHKCNNMRTTEWISMDCDIGYVMKNWQVSPVFMWIWQLGIDHFIWSYIYFCVHEHLHLCCAYFHWVCVILNCSTSCIWEKAIWSSTFLCLAFRLLGIEKMCWWDIKQEW